ncbi:putative membrane protein [Leptolyngbya sp. PCC 7375]|nr:putative membrane protein [Leptolyngbya sp. PCC 7375]
MDDNQTNHQKNRKIAALIAFLGAVQPTPVPFAGIHKFYLGQYGWGIAYLLLGATQVPRFACMIESIWYLTEPQFQRLWQHNNQGGAPIPNLGEAVEDVANSLREIEHLRQEGLLSEYEFEQKRRSLLEQIP